MAYYKNFTYLTKTDHALFDKFFEPGDTTPYSGIYRCEACGKEDASIKDKPLPSQNHHHHSISQGRIQWRLVVGYQPDPNR
jgi:hypothetical protein